MHITIIDCILQSNMWREVDTHAVWESYAGTQGSADRFRSGVLMAPSAPKRGVASAGWAEAFWPTRERERNTATPARQRAPPATASPRGDPPRMRHDMMMT